MHLVYLILFSVFALPLLAIIIAAMLVKYESELSNGPRVMGWRRRW